MLQLIWVPGHRGIVANETAHQLAKTESDLTLTGNKMTCSNWETVI